MKLNHFFEFTLIISTQTMIALMLFFAASIFALYYITKIIVFTYLFSKAKKCRIVKYISTNKQKK
jgi:hypothetical protein